MNETIRRAREIALDILKPTQREIDHGMELHKSSLVIESYGFSPRAAVDGAAVKAAIEAGAEDVTGETVSTTPENFLTVKTALEKAGVPIETAEVRAEPESTVEIKEEETAKKILHLVEYLEEDEDVNEVAANFDIAEELLQKLI